jgi:hypothetical protein|tara:strand:- start:399 stop:575 length:177 start_codon:yes stop_codon:yes gene_type:complete
MRYAFVAAHRPLFSVRTMCRCLRIHPSGFYAWLKKEFGMRYLFVPHNMNEGIEKHISG